MNAFRTMLLSGLRAVRRKIDPDAPPEEASEEEERLVLQSFEEEEEEPPEASEVLTGIGGHFLTLQEALGHYHVLGIFDVSACSPTPDGSGFGIEGALMGPAVQDLASYRAAQAWLRDPPPGAPGTYVFCGHLGNRRGTEGPLPDILHPFAVV